MRLYFLLITFFLGMGLGYGQPAINSYYALGRYADTMEITYPKLAGITQTASVLKPEHYDSLAQVVFPALQKREMNTGFQIFANQQMAVMAYQFIGDIQMALSYQQKEIELIKTTDKSSYLMMAYTRLMFMEGDLKEDDKAYDTSLKVARLLDNEEDGVNKAFALRQLSVFYKANSDFDRAESYAKAGIAHSERTGIPNYLNDFYETLVVVADNKGLNTNESVSWRKRAIEFARLNHDTLGLISHYTNLANCLAGMGMSDSARRYFELALESYNSYPYLFGWVDLAANYGCFLTEEGDYDRVEALKDTLAYVVKNNNIIPNALKVYYLFQSLYYANKGDLDDFKYWFAKRDSLLKSEFVLEKARAREEMIAKYELEKKEAQNKLLESENENKQITILSLLGISLLLIGIVVLAIQRRNRDRKIARQKEKILSNQMEQERLEKKRTEENSQRLKKELESRIKQVIEQQTINHELIELVEELRTSEESPLVRKKTAQMKSKLNEQVTASLYDDIMQKMRELYPQLFDWLKSQLGENKETEIITTSMYFMSYETKDIASLLQRTEKAVRSMRYRVRKKLLLGNQDDLVEFLKRQNHQLS